MLTPRQRRFVDEYLVDLNGTQAAIRAGYSAKTARQIGQKLLTKVDIQQAISAAQVERQKRTELTADEVIEGLRNVAAVASARKKVTVTEVVKIDGEAISHDVEKLQFDAAGANRAYELLGKHIGMFKDQVDVTTNGQAVHGVLVAPVVAKTDDEWEKYEQA